MYSLYTVGDVDKILQENVDRGADYLDKVKPDWWINVDNMALDMKDIRKCLIGQLYGHFIRYTVLGIVDPEEYGFCADSIADDSSLSTYTVYSMLTSMWNDVIDERQDN